MVWIALISSQTAPLFTSGSCKRRPERLRTTFTLPQRSLFKSAKYQTQTIQIKVTGIWNVAHRLRYPTSKRYGQLRVTEGKLEARTQPCGDGGRLAVTTSELNQLNLWESGQGWAGEPDPNTGTSRTPKACHSGEKEKKKKEKPQKQAHLAQSTSD